MAQHANAVCANVSALGATAAIGYQGGVCVLVAEATTYPTTCQLQTQSISGKWIPASGNIAGDGLYPLDLPAGQYRMSNVGGAVAALYITLVSVARK